MKPILIQKVLSKNDTSDTGSHQAGILVPKKDQIINFFPKLDRNLKNPRIVINFIDEEKFKWQFNFIYYNNKLFGGTRNEYRLTGMTKFIKQNNLKPNDSIIFELNNSQYFIRKKRTSEIRINNKLILGNSWKVINI